MMKCKTCDVEMTKTSGDYRYTESGLDNVWLREWSMFVCPQCETTLPLLPNAELFSKIITWALVRNEAILDADAILFLRKAMGLKVQDLADSLGVTRTEISRWENARVHPNPHNEFKLRILATRKILPTYVQEVVAFQIVNIFMNTRRKTKVTDFSIFPEMQATLFGSTN